jgi:hypothetical protein
MEYLPARSCPKRQDGGPQQLGSETSHDSQKISSRSAHRATLVMATSAFAAGLTVGFSQIGSESGWRAA